jgi:hypothetical protein
MERQRPRDHVRGVILSGSGLLVPQLAGVVVERVERLADRVLITATAAGERGSCPGCGASRRSWPSPTGVGPVTRDPLGNWCHSHERPDPPEVQLLAPWLTPTTSNMSARPPSPASPQEVDTHEYWLMITGPNFQWAVKVEPMMSTFARDFAAKVTGPETPPPLPAPAE